MKCGGSGPVKDVELEFSRGGAVSSTDQDNEVPPGSPITSARAEDEPGDGDSRREEVEVIE